MSRDPYRRSLQQQCSWRVAFAIASVVAIAGLLAAINQFVVNFLYDQNPHTRTLGGILAMLLGIASVGLPILLLRNRKRFLALGPSSRWLLIVAVPVLSVMAMGLCLEAALRSTTLILPRPSRPTAILRYGPNETRIEFAGRWGGGGGSNNTEVIQGVEYFSSHIDQGFIKGFLPGAPDHPDRRIVTIVGRATTLTADMIHIVLDVDARESVQFEVENLHDVKVTRDDQLIESPVLPPGTYQVSIVGSREEGT